MGEERERGVRREDVGLVRGGERLLVAGMRGKMWEMAR